jgi:hypothetical protein
MRCLGFLPCTSKIVLFRKKNKLEVEMKGKKFAIAALLFVTLIVVGVLVWPTPKPALANTDYTVRVEDTEGEPIIGLVDVQISFYNGGWGNWIIMDDDQNGDYLWTQPGVQPTRWRVRITDGDYIPVDPAQWPYEPPGNETFCPLVAVLNPIK